jgi:hypothetical protein
VDMVPASDGDSDAASACLASAAALSRILRGAASSCSLPHVRGPGDSSSSGWRADVAASARSCCNRTAVRGSSSARSAWLRFFLSVLAGGGPGMGVR